MLAFVVMLLVAAAAWGQTAPATTWTPVLEVRERALLGGTPEGLTASVVEQRARLGLEVARRAVSARVAFEDVRAWDAGAGSVSVAGDGPALSEAWVRLEGDLTRSVGAVATVGRQPIVVDEGRILGTDPFVAAGRRLDAVRFVGRAAPVEIELVNARRFDDAASTTGYGVSLVRLSAASENPVTAWVADGLWVLDARDPDAPVSTFGAYARLDSGRLRSRADGYLQADALGTASLVGLSAGWVFGPNERLVAHVRYENLSGAGDGRAWRPVLGDTRTFQGLLDLYADPDARPDGLSDAQLVLETRPAPQLGFGGVAHRLGNPRDGSAYGVELDVHAEWAFSPFARARVAGGWFTPDPPGDGAVLLGYVEVDATF